jgi:CBS domain-containing protein
MTTVKDIMTKDVVSISVDSSVFDVAEVMRSNQLCSLVIMDGEVPVGIVTERDIVRKGLRKKIAWRNQGFGDYV